MQSKLAMIMKRIFTSVVVVAIGAALSGCTILGSVGGTLPLPKEGGSAYSLPKAVLDVKLTDNSGDLVLTVGQPEYVPDVRHTYLLQYKPDPLSSDTVELTIDPKTDLLQTVNATAEDKTSQVIVELAKTAAMIAQAEVTETVIFERKIDPADLAVDKNAKALADDMRRVVKSHAEDMYKKKGCKKKDKASTDDCKNYGRMAETTVSFKVTKPTAPPADPPDCSIGVCYRVAAPYGIEFAFSSGYTYGTIVNLPNDQPPFVLPLARTVFVKRVDNAEFENGMLKKAHFEKPSEALEVASLPTTIMTAVFTSISQLVQAKIDLSDKEKGLAQSQAALLQAQKDLQDARIKVQQSAAARPTVLLSGSSSGRPATPRVPQIMISQPSAAPAPGGFTSPPSPGTLPPAGKGEDRK